MKNLFGEFYNANPLSSIVRLIILYLVITPAIVIALANNSIPSNSISNSVPRDFISSNYADYSNYAN